MAKDEAEREPQVFEVSGTVDAGSTVEQVEPTEVYTAWYNGLDEEAQQKLEEIFSKYASSQIPHVAALLEFFGIDPNTVPGNNSIYSNGYITFQRPVEDGEVTVSGYIEMNPKLNPYPEGLTYELVEAAFRSDIWNI